MLTSSVAHAFLLFFVAYTTFSLWSSGASSLFAGGLLAADVFTLIAGYAAFVILATRALDDQEKAVLPRHLWTLAAYWLLISAAAFRAFAQLTSHPHVWEKTPHRPPIPSPAPAWQAPRRANPGNSASPNGWN